MTRRLAVIALCLLLSLMAASTWLLNSERGLLWAYQHARMNLSGELEAGRISGRLVGPLTVEDLYFRDHSQRISSRRLRLDWNPWALLGAELDIQLLEIDELEVDLEPASTAAGADAAPPTIPKIDFPVTVTLHQIEITAARIRRGEQLQVIDKIASSLAIKPGGLIIDRLEFESTTLNFQVLGEVSSTPDLAHDLDFDWSSSLPSGETIRGRGKLAGDLQRSLMTQRLDGGVQGEFKIEVERPLQQLRWRANLDLVEIDSTKIDVSLPPLLGSIRIEAQGDLQSASANGSVNLEQSPYGSLESRFRLHQVALKEAADGLSFAGLELDLLQGKISADGDLDWMPQLQWRTQITTAALNPAEMLPQWAGRIDSSFRLNGIIEDSGPALSFEIERLDGQLRGYPVQLKGNADWRDSSIGLAGIEFGSGKSHVTVDGHVGSGLDLKWSLASDDLAELYPGLQGRLAAEGQLGGKFEAASIEARLRGKSLAYTDYTAAAVEAEVALDLDLFRIAELAITRLDLVLEATEIRLQDRLLHHATIQADDRRMRIDVGGDEVNLNVILEGKLEADHWQGQLAQARLQFQDYGDWRLLAPATVSAAPNRIRIDDLCLYNPQNGRFCAHLMHQGEAGSADVRLTNTPLALLQTWLPTGVSTVGLADADVALEYALPDRFYGHAEIDLQPGFIAYELEPGDQQRVGFEDARVKIKLSEAGADANIDIKLGGGDALQGSIILPGANLLDFDAAEQNLQANLNLRLRDLGLVDKYFAQIDRLQGDARIDLQIAGTMAQPLLQGSIRLDDAQFLVPDLALQLTQVKLDAHSTDSGYLEYRIDARAAGGNLKLTGRSELNANAGWPSRINLAAEQLLLTSLMQQRLPENLLVNGRVDLNADLSLRLPDRLSGSMTIASSTGSLSYPLPNGESGSWDYRDIKLDLQLKEGEMTAHGGFDIGDNKLEVGLRLPGVKPFELDPEKQVLAGEVDLAFNDLSLLDTLLPDLQRTQGQLRLQLGIGGHLAQPRLTGRAQMHGASVQVARLGISLERIDLTADTDAAGLLNFTVSARSGNGDIRLQGSSRLDSARGWPSTIEISGENFKAVRIPEATVDLSPQLNLELADRKIHIKGEIHVPYAKLQPRDVTTAARASDDVVIIGEEQNPAGRWQITTDVRLILGERVTFFGYGFDGRLGGNLVIEESPGKPTRGTGEITILEGRYRAYGQHLDVEQGRLLFTGGPLTNPGLDVRAVRKTGDVTAGINVGGRLQSPRLELFSNPALGETDTLSYLLTGGPLDSASSGQGAMMANAALALGLSGGDRIARSIGDRFGFDEMRIESSSSGDQASLVVGRYLTPQLYVGYGVGLIESINTLNLRYKITDRWQFEAESGVAQGADLFYSFER